jgi:WD40 repeat protein
MPRLLLRIVVCVCVLIALIAGEACSTTSAGRPRDATASAGATSRLAYVTESSTGDLSSVVSHLYIATLGQTPTKVRDYPGQQYYEMLASPDGSAIAVTNGAIVILDDRGDEIMRLDVAAVSFSGAGPFAAWSPDSSRFAYTRIDPATGGRVGWIETVDVAKRTITTPVKLKSAQLAMPSFAPDGTRFAAVEMHDSGNSMLAIVDAGSGDYRTLPGQPAATLATPLWSPDGQWIAYWLPNELTGSDGRVLDRGESVYITTPDGAAPRRIAAATFLSPQAWSPDGKRLALSCAVLDKQGSVSAANVCVADAAGGAPTQLTDDGGSFWAAFAPDGTHIAFLSDQDKTTGTYTLKVVNLGTRETTTIASSVPIGGFSWLPWGRLFRNWMRDAGPQLPVPSHLRPAGSSYASNSVLPSRVTVRATPPGYAASICGSKPR